MIKKLSDIVSKVDELSSGIPVGNSAAATLLGAWFNNMLFVFLSITASVVVTNSPDEGPIGV